MREMFGLSGLNLFDVISYTQCYRKTVDESENLHNISAALSGEVGCHGEEIGEVGGYCQKVCTYLRTSWSLYAWLQR